MATNFGSDVGIGVASPATKLEVASGDIRLTDAYVIEWGGTNARIGGSNAGNYLKFYTSDTVRMKIDTSSHITPGADNTQNLGSSSLRWANLYVGDMHFSNEGKEGGNEIDGTTGNWTIQEGDENLFVINRKTGKKFKMNLTEV